MGRLGYRMSFVVIIEWKSVHWILVILLIISEPGDTEPLQVDRLRWWNIVMDTCAWVTPSPVMAQYCLQGSYLHKANYVMCWNLSSFYENIDASFIVNRSLFDSVILSLSLKRMRSVSGKDVKQVTHFNSWTMRELLRVRKTASNFVC